MHFTDILTARLSAMPPDERKAITPAQIAEMLVDAMAEAGRPLITRDMLPELIAEMQEMQPKMAGVWEQLRREFPKGSREAESGRRMAERTWALMRGQHDANAGDAMNLVWPAALHLPSYRAALERGWSPDNLRADVAQEHLARIADDPAAFLSSLVDREAKGPPVVLPDGSTAPRLPGYTRWMWDGDFCGAINFRWQPGTGEMPPYCLGHIGYAVVPWKRGKGYATKALALILDDARREKLPYVDLTTELENVPSRRVIEANGGKLAGEFDRLAAHGGTRGLRYRIPLAP